MSFDPITDEALFAGVRERDPRAWEAFVDRFGALVASVPTRAGLSRDAVDDVVQATWLLLLRHAPLIRVPRSLPSWVLTTTARETWRVQARERSRRGVERESASNEQQPPSEVSLMRLEDVHAVREALGRLGARCRRLLEALFLRTERPRYEDLALELGISIGSIGPTRKRCLARMAEDLERRGFAPEGGRLE